jgi:hypothetical protein
MGREADWKNTHGVLARMAGVSVEGVDAVLAPNT